MRVFPLWSDYQPLTRLHAGGNEHVGFLQNNGPFQNDAAVDEEMMRRFRVFCDICRANDIRLVVGLVTGWISGRMFVPPAFDECNVLTDPDAVMWETRFVRHFVREMKDHPAIAAWDFGNECNCMGKASTAEFYNWMNAIGSAIRLADPTRPVVFVTDRPDAYTASGAIQVTDVPALTYRLPRYGFMHEHSPIGLVLGGETASTFSSRG